MFDSQRLGNTSSGPFTPEENKKIQELSDKATQANKEIKQQEPLKQDEVVPPQEPLNNK